MPNLMPSPQPIVHLNFTKFSFRCLRRASLGNVKNCKNFLVYLLCFFRLVILEPFSSYIYISSQLSPIDRLKLYGHQGYFTTHF